MEPVVGGEQRPDALDPSRSHTGLRAEHDPAAERGRSGLLRHQRAPALVVATDDRDNWTPERVTAAAEVLPDGAPATARGAMALAPVEQPAATAEVVVAFWSRTASR